MLRRLPLRSARVYFERLITALRAVARVHGYALALHGSVARDIDLLAAPWVITASDARTLVYALRDCVADILGCSAFVVGDAYHQKPHGRTAWTIVWMDNHETFIDISVMPVC